MKTKALYSALIAMLLSAMLGIYVLVEHISDASIADGIAYILWIMAPYCSLAVICMVFRRSKIPCIMIYINITAAVALFAGFLSGPTAEWSLAIIPIYQLIITVVAWPIVYLTRPRKIKQFE